MSEERQDPETMAYTFYEYVADTEPEPGDYVRRFVDELFELEPGLREHFSDMLMTELKEDIARKTDDGGFGGTAIELVEEIQADWRRDA